ncbi:MAG: class I SAM-dependent methyltransferase [Bacteroidales bacterium]|nr:class I SAM-dependent methyltransferase [Bacteroidales bacterium]
MDIKIFYDQKYATFESLPGFQAEREYCIRIIQWMKMMEIWPAVAERYLDAGCGFGLKTYIFSEYFQHSTGIDFSHNVAEICKILNNKPDSLEFQITDIENLEGVGYDLITAFGLSYFNISDMGILAARIEKQVDKLLNRGGVFLITTRTGPSSNAGTGWHLLNKTEIKVVKHTLRNNLRDCRIDLFEPDKSWTYLRSGKFLQVSGSVYKTLMNKPRDLFIIIRKDGPDAGIK